MEVFEEMVNLSDDVVVEEKILVDGVGLAMVVECAESRELLKDVDDGVDSLVAPLGHAELLETGQGVVNAFEGL